jgi:hypothetical protein
LLYQFVYCCILKRFLCLKQLSQAISLNMPPTSFSENAIRTAACVLREMQKNAKYKQQPTEQKRRGQMNVCVLECAALALFWLSLFVSGAGTVAISRGNFILFVFAAERQKCVKGARPLQSANRLAKTS